MKYSQISRFLVQMLKAYFRDRLTLFWSALFPILMFVLLKLLFGRWMGNFSEANSGHNSLLASMLVLGAFSNGIFGGGMSLAISRESGMLKRFKLAGMTRTNLLVLYGLRITTGGLISFVSVSLASWLMVQEFPPVFHVIPIELFAASTIVALSIGLCLGLLSTTIESSNALSNVLFLPLTFLGGVAVPINMLPKMVQPIAEFLPTAPYVIAMQEQFMYGEIHSMTFVRLVCPVIIGVLCLYITASFRFLWRN